MYRIILKSIKFVKGTTRWFQNDLFKAIYHILRNLIYVPIYCNNVTLLHNTGK